MVVFPAVLPNIPSRHGESRAFCRWCRIGLGGTIDIVIIFNRQSGTDDKGKHHLVLQFDMFRVQNGVIVEHWDADTWSDAV